MRKEKDTQQVYARLAESFPTETETDHGINSQHVSQLAFIREELQEAKSD